MASLYKRGNIWYSRIYINGEEVRRPLSSDKRIAEERLGDLIKQRNAARHGHAPRNMAWPEFRDSLLATSKANLEKSTWQSEARAYREMEMVLPIQRIHQITPQLLEEVIKPAWIARKRGKYVINRDLRSIRSAMRKAEAYRYIERQDWKLNKYIKTPKGRLHFWTTQELLNLREVCRGIWRTVLYLGSRAGLRRGEIRHLPWSNVDFVRDRIHIAPTDEWSPKDHERRYIPMAPDLKEYLASIKNGDQFVFSDHGERPTVGSMTEYFSRLVGKAKPKLTGSLHTLRHSFGAHLASAGVPLKIIGEWMGHENSKTTDIYSHLIPNITDQAIQHLPPLPSGHSNGHT